MAQLAPGEVYNAETHRRQGSCKDCHATIYEEWQDSPHAFASFNNPYYRIAFDTFAEDVGRQKTAHCAGCHDPTLLFDKTILSRTIKANERRAHLGVNCNTCHGIVEATTDGNGSYVLSTLPIPVPKPSAPNYAQQLVDHKKRLASPALHSNELCASCHKGFLSSATGHQTVITGLDEYTSYRRSGYNSNPVTRVDSHQAPKRCVDCHMPPKNPSGHRSHRFMGGHTTLAAAIGAKAQLESTVDTIRSAASIDVAAWGVGKVSLQHAPPRQLQAEERIWIDVVVYNEGTGHRFPGGALDLRDTWIEIELSDASGRVLAEAGTQHETSADDTSAMQLNAVVADHQGKLVKSHRVHNFRTPVANHSIAPKDALIVRYLWAVPSPPPPLPLKATAKLRHRRLQRVIHTLGCEASKTRRGRGFIRYSRIYLNRSVDPCISQPVVTIGQATSWMGHTRSPLSSSSPRYPAWQRHWHRGLGLLHNLGENVHEAREAFSYALQLIPEEAEDLTRAIVLFSLGSAQAQQGRLPQALATWDKAETLAPKHPAIAFARGKAYQRTFRNKEALPWFQDAAAAVNDDRVWRAMAKSAASIMRPRDAYSAAQRGLLLAPRNPNLLRIQMLALKSIRGIQHPATLAALQSFEQHKADETQARIKDLCASKSPECHNHRQPMRTLWLRTTTM